MKAIIAAAGKGTRMKELGYDCPKHLIQVLGRPFLYYLLDNLKAAGYDEIIVVAGYKFEMMEKAVKDYDSKVEVVSQFEKMGEDRYGTMIPLLAGREFIGDEDFVFVSGDNYYGVDDLKRMNINDNTNYIASIKNDYPELYGAIRKDEKNELIEIVEKPEEFVSHEISIGLYKFEAEVFDKLKEVDESKRGEFELTDAINFLAKEHKVKVIEFKNHWFDFGKPEDLPKFEEFLKKEV
ncbi:MAG: sugar phosphate nucleotidyltransferase [Patescibacteria group bacterium]